MLNFHGLIGDLKKATDESDNKTLLHFVVSDYRYHLIRINEFLIDRLQLLITGATENEAATER